MIATNDPITYASVSRPTNGVAKHRIRRFAQTAGWVNNFDIERCVAEFGPKPVKVIAYVPRTIKPAPPKTKVESLVNLETGFLLMKFGRKSVSTPNGKAKIPFAKENVPQNARKIASPN